MTPIEKAEDALNRRIERIQLNLRESKAESARQFLVQSLVVCIGLGEALRDYVKTIGQYAQGRHGELKQTHDALVAQHADLLTSGNELLARLKANPTDQGIRKEIERAQQNMANIQKALRRGANALQRELAPSMAMIDPLALSVRRLCDADELDGLKRAMKMVVGLARDLYASQSTLPVKDVIDATAWEKSAVTEVDQGTDFYDAFARAGYQAMLALDVMTMAVSPTPPQTAEAATDQANASVAARLKAIAARFSNG